MLTQLHPISSESPAQAAAQSTPVSPVAQEVNPLNPKGLKPCCACPETKSARDDCFIKSAPGEGDIACKDLIEAHKACMRGYGFKV
ncbi:cytochrome c oxidase assembly protein subunit 17 [Cryptococcus wingfieldii CBS 7118]|uniref:Cytochrome c oxidase assembly protein subunit 17 n=1 Tax=Cryptococcus wingfieldii CBS 7118 TaxID=1295528 RepID=A0A1E3JZG4_9TREE|nr:cytochrome c oxidase assembly protein subunit 17 [Cryptococcus wingfieldii CBS 7118]ODO06240.1 cytochrome c oxidase assembly protein subunit 17 [Cryptococcus wingfieldii CBS 7118]